MHALVSCCKYIGTRLERYYFQDCLIEREVVRPSGSIIPYNTYIVCIYFSQVHTLTIVSINKYPMMYSL